MERIKMMRGSADRADEVREWLKNQGAEDLDYISCDDNTIMFSAYNGKVVLYVISSGYYNALLSHDLIEIVKLPEKPKQPECPFKPFDKVLMKDYDGKWWPEFFSCVNEDEEDMYRFCSIGDGAYQLCIPYEGNEHLAFTYKNPEE